LKALAALEAQSQAEVLELISGDKPAAASVADAILKISGEQPATDTQKREKTVTQYLPKLGKHFRATLFRGFKDEILDLVKREGWLDA
jgi:predicted Ser/Thr protein kinase